MQPRTVPVCSYQLLAHMHTSVDDKNTLGRAGRRSRRGVWCDAPRVCGPSFASTGAKQRRTSLSSTPVRLNQKHGHRAPPRCMLPTSCLRGLAWPLHAAHLLYARLLHALNQVDRVDRHVAVVLQRVRHALACRAVRRYDSVAQHDTTTCVRLSHLAELRTRVHVRTPYLPLLEPTP